MIRGKKTQLRALEESDLPLIVDWLNDPDISQSVVGWSFPVSRAAQREWYATSIRNSASQRWIVETLEGETIGLTGLWDINWQSRHALTALKIGAKSLQGKGFGSDAIMAIMSYAFYEVGLSRLWGEIISFNVPSYTAYVERCGWRVEGILRNHVYRSGMYCDVIRVGILKEQFEQLPRAAEYIPSCPNERVMIRPEHWHGSSDAYRG